MEIINCPVCGEENPAGLENCEHCNQSLNQSTSELKGTGKLIDSGHTPTAQETSELEHSLPAWLKNARQGAVKEEKEPEESPSPPPPVEPEPEIEAEAEAEKEDDAASLDWLAGLDSDEGEDGEEAAGWLVNLQSDLAPEKEEEIPEGIPAVDEPITAGDAPRPSEEEEPAIKTSELPNWVSDLQGDEKEDDVDALPDLFAGEEKEEPADADDGELPDWLSTLSKEKDSSIEPSIETSPVQPASVQETDATPLDKDADESLPDWMGDLQASAETEISSVEDASPITSDDDLPDWMTDSTPAESVKEENEETPINMGDLLDWRSDGEDSSPAVEEKPVAAEETPLDAGDDLPEWMADSAPTEEVKEEIEEAPINMGDLPDWLSDGEDSSPLVEEKQDVVEDAFISSDEDLPDWMSTIESVDNSVAEETAESDSPSSVSDDEPEWLSALPVDDFSSQGVEKAAEVEAGSQVFDTSAESTDGIEDADIPDWLSKIGKPATGPLDEAKLDPSPAEEDSSDPDWLEDLPTVGKEEVEAMPSVAAFLPDDTTDDAEDDIFGIEAPDWLSSLGPEDIDDDFPADETEVSVESAGGAELPSWVQAMRPVADVVADSSKASDEQLVAESGPLAGLSGILPANPGLGTLNKPRAQSIYLQVGESQQSSAVILEELLAKESQPSPFKTPKKTSSIPLLRWLIAALLFFGVATSLLSQTEMVASPAKGASEVQEAFNVVNSIPAGGSALVVFDYEAAFSAEMKTVAAPLISQLMSRGEMLITLSTSPMGPALAKNSLTEIIREPSQLVAGENYIDLGYLPGDVSAMLGFVSDPKAMIPKRIGDKSVWELPPLQNITNFYDFSVILILTDDVEKGRNWIEQSTQALNDSDTPLLMAVSAQAEPIIYPYYDSGQVDGLVSGLSGGMTLEQKQKKENGLARKYWDSYSVGLFLAEILIAVGAMVNFMAALKSGQRKKEEK